MDSLKFRWRITVVLLILSLTGLIFMHLALTDINKGVEPDLTAEWNIVRGSVIIYIAFIISVFFLGLKLKNVIGRK